VLPATTSGWAEIEAEHMRLVRECRCPKAQLRVKGETHERERIA
jgi:hypothetical protein